MARVKEKKRLLDRLRFIAAFGWGNSFPNTPATPASPRRKRISHRASPAFTLIEIMLALAIFSLLAGAVFFSVQAVGNASAILGTEQLRARKTDAFLSWCRKGFHNLSARSEIALQTRDSGAAGLAVELVIHRAPGAFSLGEFDAGGTEIVLGAIPDGRGAATVSVARFPGNLTEREQRRYLEETEWIPLLEGVKNLSWTFWNPAEKKFLEEWPEGQGLPEMIHLKMVLDSGEIVEAVFRPPTLQKQTETAQPNDTPSPSPVPVPPIPR